MPVVRATMAVLACFSTSWGARASWARFERAFFGFAGATSGVDMGSSDELRVVVVVTRALVKQSEDEGEEEPDHRRHGVSSSEEDQRRGELHRLVVSPLTSTGSAAR